MFNEVQIRSELLEYLKRDCYQSMFYRLNEFRTPSGDRRAHQKADQPYTPASVAREAAHALARFDMLLEPKVRELSGYAELYRAHDGSNHIVAGTESLSAGTLGGSWVGRDLIAEIWRSANGMPSEARRPYFIETLRRCSLVLEKWNAGTQMACMQVPDGCRVVVVEGKGNWRALYPKDGRPLTAGLKDELKKMARDPTIQYFVPVYQPSWIMPVTDPNWPLIARRSRTSNI
jgi:hypothetical protein